MRAYVDNIMLIIEALEVASVKGRFVGIVNGMLTTFKKMLADILRGFCIISEEIEMTQELRNLSRLMSNNVRLIFAD